MVSKRKFIIIISTLLLVSLMSVMFTIALLTDVRATTNEFNFGEVRVSLYETEPETTELTPGMRITREPVIKNKGTECYVRARVMISDAGLNNQAIHDFITFDDLNDNWYIPDNAGESWNDSDMVTVYYKDSIIKGEETTPIFDCFVLDVFNGDEALLEAANEGFKIDIVVEAVQASVGDRTFESAEEAFHNIEVLPAS